MSLEEPHVVVAYAAVGRDLERHQIDLATQRAHLRSLTQARGVDDDAVYERALLMIASQQGEWESILRLTDRMTTTKVTIDQLTAAHQALWETKDAPATPPPTVPETATGDYVSKRHERCNCRGGAAAGAFTGDTVTLAVATTGDHHPVNLHTPVVPGPERRALYAAAARTVRLRLGPNAIAQAQCGEPIILNMNEADALADAVTPVADAELRDQAHQLTARSAPTDET